MEDESRFAQLALEVIGAKAAAEFLKEAWEYADDDAKQRMATALVDSVTKRAAAFDYQYAVDDLIKKRISDVVRSEIAAQEEELGSRIRAAVGSALVRYIESESVDRMVQHAMEGILQKVRERISSALSGVR